MGMENEKMKIGRGNESGKCLTLLEEQEEEPQLQLQHLKV